MIRASVTSLSVVFPHPEVDTIYKLITPIKQHGEKQRQGEEFISCKCVSVRKEGRKERGD